MKIRGGGILLTLKKRREVGLLSGGGLQRQGDELKLKRGVDPALIVGCDNPGVHMTSKCYPMRVINGCGNTYALGEETLRT